MADNLDKKLIERLYEYPYDSEEYYEVREKIMEHLSQIDEYHKYLICIKSNLSSYKPCDLARLQGLVRFQSDSYVHSYFSHDSFMEDETFVCIQRSKAEYNLALKQLVVAGYITDGNNIILLKSHHGRIDDKITMIQGHVEFESQCYFKSQLETLRANFARELEEEILIEDGNGKVYLDIPSEPKYLFNGNSHVTHLEHFGIIYEIKVKNLDELNFISNEPEKHSVVKIPLNKETCTEYAPLLDNWFIHVYEKLIQEKYDDSEYKLMT